MSSSSFVILWASPDGHLSGPVTSLLCKMATSLKDRYTSRIFPHAAGEALEDLPQGNGKARAAPATRHGHDVPS